MSTPYPEAPADRAPEPSLKSLSLKARAEPREPAPRLTGAHLARFLSYYRPHLPLLAADLACAILVSATALALPLCANWVVRRLASGHAGPSLMADIYGAGGLMLALLAAQAIANIFVDYQGHVMGAKMEAALRQDLFEHYQKLSFSFYDRQRVGQLMGRITGDLFNISELYHHGPEDLAIAVLKFTGAVALMLSLDAPLTLLILAAVPFAAAYALVFSGRMHRALRQARVRIGAINERVEDALLGIRVVKAFTNEALETRRFAEENHRFLDTRRRGYRSEAFFSVGLATFAQLVTVAVVVVGAAHITRAALSAADLVTYLLCAAILTDPIGRVVNIARLSQEGLTGFHRFMEIMEVTPDIGDAPGAKALAGVRGAISFRDVSFAYQPGGRRVLNRFSLEVAPGEFVALIGYSGVGKTTLCSLVPRFYEADEGQVLIDGQDVRGLTLASLRQAIGLVQQDVYLFAGTVAENLRYGRPDAPFDDVVRAAKHAHAHDFIMSLPDGYDTDIGQRGVMLSGGQKQRLTIARVFLKDPPILIFDEATSALDNDSERAVQAALHTLAKGRTTLVIAHRLSTVRHADRIVVLTDQGVAEQGTHEALMAAGGAYATLYASRASL
ncbi:MAG: ABC transporter ATP-binding protein [Proteobacteria bacterium]|nr:ABC transporter ATP-binding protein [Pseudomonadota bacterium]